MRGSGMRSSGLLGALLLLSSVAAQDQLAQANKEAGGWDTLTQCTGWTSLSPKYQVRLARPGWRGTSIRSFVAHWRGW
jgi:DMSO/TMAO reductase YedYZ molybdopterin-dependent catalytic subunit